MPNDIDLSTEALLKHQAIAEKATPSFIQEGLSIYGPLHPDSKHPNGRIFVARIAEGSNRRNPDLFGAVGIGTGLADAAHIAANSPNVVKAHIDEILRLRAEVERLNKEADYLAGVIAAAYCAQENVTHCEKTEGLPLHKLRDACASCWREAARMDAEKNP